MSSTHWRGWGGGGEGAWPLDQRLLSGRGTRGKCERVKSIDGREPLSSEGGEEEEKRPSGRRARLDGESGPFGVNVWHRSPDWFWAVGGEGGGVRATAR